MSIARRFAAVAVLSGSIYVMGGRDNQQRYNSVECYTPGVNKWISLAPMNEIRSAAQAGTANGALFIFGGIGQIGVSSTIETYDPKEDKWTMVIHNSTANQSVWNQPTLVTR